ncbi:GroES-like protein [Dipodascopsis uninucleata]
MLAPDQRRVATRSLTFTYPGSDPHWTYDSIPLPIAKNLILIRVVASTLSSVDMAILHTSALWAKPGEKGFGREYAGIVEAAGEAQASQWNVGETVCGLFFHPFGAGTLASHILVDPSRDSIIRESDLMPTIEAAAFPLSFTLAHQCIKNLNLNSESCVCVLGGASSVGLFLIQLLKFYQVKRIVATCSPDSENLVRYVGADVTLDYKESEDIVPLLLSAGNTTSPAYDAIIDTVGTESKVLPRIKELLSTKSGIFITTVGDGKDGQIPLPYLDSGSIRKSLMGAIVGPRYKLETVQPSIESLELCMSLYKQGQIKIVVDSVYNWDKYQDAIAKLKERSYHGKLVIKIDEF